jgi:hypothetical protein
MGAFSPPGARLNALIGDAVLDIPAHLVERLEKTLEAQGMQDPTPTLLAHLTLMHHGESADGTLWEEQGLGPGRCGDLAIASRSLQALHGVLQILHAAQRTRRHAGPEQQLGDHLEEALYFAGRQLAQTASDALHGRR